MPITASQRHLRVVTDAPAPKGTVTQAISNSDDTIEGLDVINRIAALEGTTALTGQEARELAALRALAQLVDLSGEEMLVRDSYFVTYARELAVDAEWPLIRIDWEQAASELQAGYTSVSFASVTYWVPTTFA